MDSEDTEELIRQMELYANKKIPTRQVEKANITEEMYNMVDNIGY